MGVLDQSITTDRYIYLQVTTNGWHKPGLSPTIGHVYLLLLYVGP